VKFLHRLIGRKNQPLEEKMLDSPHGVYITSVPDWQSGLDQLGKTLSKENAFLFHEILFNDFRGGKK
jgi:hypothetical protein